MSLSSVVPSLHRVALGAVNAYLLEDPSDDPAGLALIDAGFPDKAGVVLAAIAELRRKPADLRHIVCTHAHYDHIGSLAALKAATGAQTWMHRIDVPLAESGGPFRPLTKAPGLLPSLLFAIFAKPDARTEPATIDHRVEGGDVLPIAGGLRAIRAPGHCAGQIALLWQDRDVLFAGDVATNLFGLGPPLGYENRRDGERSQVKLGGYAFDVACFGHGKPIVGNAGERWRRRWPPAGT